MNNCEYSLFSRQYCTDHCCYQQHILAMLAPRKVFLRK